MNRSIIFKCKKQCLSGIFASYLKKKKIKDKEKHNIGLYFKLVFKHWVQFSFSCTLGHLKHHMKKDSQVS